MICPKCGSDNTRMIGNIESNEFGNGDPPVDTRVWACGDCFDEWEVPRP